MMTVLGGSYTIKGITYVARYGVTTKSRRPCLVIHQGETKLGAIVETPDGWAIRETTGCRTVPKTRARTVAVAILDLLEYRARKNLS